METLYGESAVDIKLLETLVKNGTPVLLHMTAFHLRPGSDKERPELMDFRYGMVPIIMATDVIYVSPTGKRLTLKSRGSKPHNPKLETFDEYNPESKMGEWLKDQKDPKNKFDGFKGTSFNPNGEHPQFFPKDSPDEHFKEKSFDEMMKDEEDEKGKGGPGGGDRGW